MKNIQQTFEHALDSTAIKNEEGKTYTPSQVKAALMFLIDDLSESAVNIAYHSTEFLKIQNLNTPMTYNNILSLMLDMVNDLVDKKAYHDEAKGTHSKEKFSLLATDFIIDTIENQSAENMHYLLGRFNKIQIVNDDQTASLT